MEIHDFREVYERLNKRIKLIRGSYLFHRSAHFNHIVSHLIEPLVLVYRDVGILRLPENELIRICERNTKFLGIYLGLIERDKDFRIAELLFAEGHFPEIKDTLNFGNGSENYVLESKQRLTE